ncbi:MULTISPECIES: PASTA domain-containing protein [Flavobacteriaceae]|uniref:PASTA domain-containing protein n=2 Tax=Flavobacteriaceae TaxID=49546 RepID=A0A4Y8AVK8_9FLAO|nr:MULTISPECIES: PASTA domain-containing protein [Flavobacteriaceae]TEW75400.1 PASTA domain-containing protein [Gramella jeungdoensis]GGK44909.1 PASTA domain-containing protein [Lutibacter litoralis]
MSLIQFIKSKIFLKQVIIAFVGLVVFVFVVMKWLNISTNHDQKIEVPNLEKMSLSEVEKTLKELDLKLFVIDSASYNPEYPKKSVIDQDPGPGEFVKENRKIYLTLNPTGYRNIEVPNVFGKSKRQVTSQLSSIGFKISANPIYVSDIAKDVVRGLKFNGKDLKAGDKIPKNSIITLKLGDGEGTGRYTEGK